MTLLAPSVLLVIALTALLMIGVVIIYALRSKGDVSAGFQFKNGRFYIEAKDRKK